MAVETECCNDGKVSAIAVSGNSNIINLCCDDGSNADESETTADDTSPAVDDVPMTSDDSTQQDGWIGDSIFAVKCSCAGSIYTLFAQWDTEGSVVLSLNGISIYEGTNPSYQHELGERPDADMELELVGMGVHKLITLSPLDCGNCDDSILQLQVGCIAGTISFAWQDSVPPYTLSVNGTDVYTGELLYYEFTPDPMEPQYDGVITDTDGNQATASILTSECVICDTHNPLWDITGIDTGNKVATEMYSQAKWDSAVHSDGRTPVNPFASSIITDIIPAPEGATCIYALRFKYRRSDRNWEQRFTAPSPCTQGLTSLNPFYAITSPTAWMSGDKTTGIKLISTTVADGKATIVWQSYGGWGVFGNPICRALEGIWFG